MGDIKVESGYIRDVYKDAEAPLLISLIVIHTIHTQSGNLYIYKKSQLDNDIST